MKTLRSIFLVCWHKFSRDPQWIFVLLLVMVSGIAHAQSKGDTSVALQPVGEFSKVEGPLFILKAQGKMAVMQQKGDFEESLKSYEILPDWIESITVLKGESAINAYGEKAKFGAIEIDFKVEAWKQVPKKLKDKFTDK
jgi:hypothetical protein